MSSPIIPPLAKTIVTNSSQAEILTNAQDSTMVASEDTFAQNNTPPGDDSNFGIPIPERRDFSPSDTTNSATLIAELHLSSSPYSVFFRKDKQNLILSPNEVKYLSGFAMQGEQYNSLVETAYSFKANTPDLESIERFRKRLKELEMDQNATLVDMKCFLSDLILGPEDLVGSFPSIENDDQQIPKEYLRFAEDLLDTRDRFLRKSTSQISITPDVNRRRAIGIIAAAAAAAAGALLSRNSFDPGSQTVTQAVTQPVTPQEKRKDLLKQLSAAPDQSSSRIITNLTLEQALDRIESIDDLANYRFRLGDLLDARSVSYLREEGKVLWQDEKGTEDLVLGALSLQQDTLKNDWKSAVASYVKCFFNMEDFVTQIAKSKRNIGPDLLIGFANNLQTIKLASKSTTEAPVIVNEKYGKFSFDVDLDLLKRQMGKTQESGRLYLSGHLFKYNAIDEQVNPAI
jgi:hypothetical protein